eukprot:20565_1
MCCGIMLGRSGVLIGCLLMLGACIFCLLTISHPENMPDYLAAAHKMYSSVALMNPTEAEINQMHDLFGSLRISQVILRNYGLFELASVALFITSFIHMLGAVCISVGRPLAVSITVTLSLTVLWSLFMSVVHIVTFIDLLGRPALKLDAIVNLIVKISQKNNVEVSNLKD